MTSSATVSPTSPSAVHPTAPPRIRLFTGEVLLPAPVYSNVDAAGTARRTNSFAGGVGLWGGVRLAPHDADGDGW